MALGDFRGPVGFCGEGARLETARPTAETHGPAHFVNAEKFAELVNDAIRRPGIEFGGIGVGDAGGAASIFDRGALHAEADAEKRNFLLARVSDGIDHAFDAALAEAAGNEDAVHVAEPLLGGGG